jgi:hypothetical protein
MQRLHGHLGLVSDRLSLVEHDDGTFSDAAPMGSRSAGSPDHRSPGLLSRFVALDRSTTAHDRLVRTIERSEFASVLNVLMSGDEGEVNEVRALQRLADRGGDNISSRPVATRYGFSSHSRVRPALERLQRRGLVDQRDGTWYIVDPLFGEWLRRASPLADRPMLLEPPDDS